MTEKSDKKKEKEIILLSHYYRSREKVYVPMLTLVDERLLPYGFALNTLVLAKATHEVITFTACGTGEDAYKQTVPHARQNNQAILYVTRNNRGNLHLRLASYWLLKRGFHPYDAFTLRWSQEVITLTKLPLPTLDVGSVRLMRCVTMRIHGKGEILVSGTFLDEMNFYEGIVLAVKLSYGSIKLVPTDKKLNIYRRKHYQSPAYVLVKRRNSDQMPQFYLCGHWLKDVGFFPHDRVIISATPKQIHITKV